MKNITLEEAAIEIVGTARDQGYRAEFVVQMGCAIANVEVVVTRVNGVEYGEMYRPKTSLWSRIFKRGKLL